MGINAQTSVPKFSIGDVLTAANTNLLTNAPPVFSGTATRDAAFGGAGEKTLAEGQLCYLEDSNIVQYYDGAAWATVGPSSSGLTLIKAETAFTGQSSFNVANVFSTTYNNYLIWIRNTAATSSGGMRFQISGSGTPTSAGYSYQRFIAYGSLTAAARTGNTTSAYLQEGGGAYFSQCLLHISNPFNGQMTYTATNSLSDAGYFTPDFEAYSGNQQTAVASQDGFTLLSITGTITGTYTVYGYAKS